MKPLKEHPFINTIRKRCQQGQNTNIVVIGANRSGKSWVALKVGETTTPRFNIGNVAWTIMQFSGIINNDRIKDGDVVIFDEVGVGAKARHWYEEQNNKFIDLMQTYGYRHLISIMTTPSLDYVDSGARKLFHYLIETTGKRDFKEGWVRCKIRRINYNPKTGKFYYPALVYSGRKKVFTRVWKPSKKLCNEYEQASNLWKENLSNDINRYLIQQEKNEQPIEKLTEIVRNKKDYFLKESRYKHKTIADVDRISNYLGIGVSKARKIKKIIEDELSLPHDNHSL